MRLNQLTKANNHQHEKCVCWGGGVVGWWGGINSARTLDVTKTRIRHKGKQRSNITTTTRTTTTTKNQGYNII